ncbi:MAG: helix-turn-helix transcriptional regulator, partial [Planctomycetes bacterium]|nr:helix-turn-helix transcriptional regulator [Planctomycetota bacterium]
MANLTPYDQARLWTGLQRVASDPGPCQILTYDKKNLQHWAGADVHPVPSLLLCLEGVVRLRIQAKTVLSIQPGESIVLAPGVCHEHIALRRGSVCFEQGFLGDASDYEFFSDQNYARALVPQQPYRRYCEQLLVADVADVADEVERGDIISELLQALIAERRHVQREQSPAMKEMIQYMIKYAHTPIAAKDIIRASGLQHAQAYKIFTDFYQQSPFQVLQERRVDIACAQLQ